MTEEIGRQDTQHNGTQNNDSQHGKTQHNIKMSKHNNNKCETQHQLMLSIAMQPIMMGQYFECPYAECRYAERHGSKTWFL